MKINKALLFVGLVSSMLMGCNNNQNSSNTNSKDLENISLSTTNFDLKYKMKDEKIYPVVILKSDTKESLYSDQPIVLNVRSVSTGIMETFNEDVYSDAYSSIVVEDNVCKLKGEIRTDNNSLIEVEDVYSIKDDALVLKRNILIKEANEKDAGYSSTIRFVDANSKSSTDYDYFMPSIIYKDTRNMTSGAIFSNVDLVGKIYVKETRTGLPMMFLRNKVQNYAFSLAHIDLNVSAANIIGGGEKGAISNDIQYGGIGMGCSPYKSVDFVYPCAEGPVTYDAGSTWAKRYHKFEVNNKTQFSVGLYAEKSLSYQQSMVNAYEKMYELINPTIEEMNIDQVYEDNMEIFKNEYRENQNGDFKFGGQPWSLRLPDARATQGYSSQMGFVGQQIPVGYQMYRYGVLNNDVDTKAKGMTILNFWSSPVIHTTYFPHVWWEPSNGVNCGTPRSYPCFLRCMIDGMEGMLDAYIESVHNSEPQENWINCVTRFATNLVNVQNSNGSFYRAYNLNGTVSTDNSDQRFQGESELNTPIAIRFLCKMYEFSGDIKYLNAAKNAAEYCYDNLYMNIGKYVGGTPDNPNTVDKEASVYAMYAFTSIYMLTNDAKYLEAAKHAAVSTMSWIYVYDFKVPSSSSNEKINTFKNGGTKGFSFIATGHSSSDNYAAYTYYELYKLYLLTQNETFKNYAHFVQNNTKLCTDYDGRMSFKYRALMPEATIVAEFAFASVGTWLPWSSIANIEPIVNMEKTFNEMDISKIKSNIDELTNQLTQYGVGGKL